MDASTACLCGPVYQDSVRTSVVGAPDVPMVVQIGSPARARRWSRRAENPGAGKRRLVAPRHALSSLRISAPIASMASCHCSSSTWVSPVVLMVRSQDSVTVRPLSGVSSDVILFIR